MPIRNPGVLRYATITPAKPRASHSHAASAYPDQPADGVSVDRSMLIWIGRTIEPRYFQKNSPKGAIVPFAATPVADAAYLAQK